MTSDNSLEQLNHRRDYFQKYFPLRIGRKRIDVNSFEVLKTPALYAVTIQLKQGMYLIYVVCVFGKMTGKMISP